MPGMTQTCPSTLDKWQPMYKGSNTCIYTTVVSFAGYFYTVDNSVTTHYIILKNSLRSVMEHTLRVNWSEEELVNCMLVHDGYLVNESTFLKLTESQTHASTSTPVGNCFFRLRHKDFTPPLVPYMILVRRSQEDALVHKYN